MALADTLNTNLGGIPGQVQQKTRAGAEALAGMEAAVAERQRDLSAPIQAEKEREVGAQQQTITDVGKKMAQPIQIPQETVADFSTLGGLVAVAGVMLGTSGKMSAQNVLNSMTGIMDGYKKGRTDLISNYQKEFDMNQKRMQSQIQQAQAELSVILEKYKTKDQTVAQDLAMFKAKYNQGIAATVADAQSADKIASLQVQFAKIARGESQATARLDLERETNDKKNVIINQKTGERGYMNSKTGKFVPLNLPEGFALEGKETKAPSTVIIDGKPHQWNGKTNQWEPVKVGDKSAETLTRPGPSGKGGELSEGGSYQAMLQKIYPPGMKAPAKEAEAQKIWEKIVAIKGLQKFYEKSDDPAIRFGEIGNAQTRIESIYERNFKQFFGGENQNRELTDAEVNKFVAQTMSDFQNQNKLTDADKNVVFGKEYIFNAIEAERAARNGPVPVYMLKNITPLLSPKNMTKEAFQKIWGDRISALSTAIPLPKEALATAIDRLPDYSGSQSSVSPQVKIQRAVEAAGLQYDPSRFEYRINADGTVDYKAK